MNARHWMQLALWASTVALAGAAIAQGANPAYGNDARSGVATQEPPAAGAIVTPEDKALGMGKHDESASRERDRSPANDDISASPGRSSDDISVNPGAPRDEMSVYPQPPNDAMNVNPDRGDANASPTRPGDMGPQDMRGQ